MKTIISYIAKGKAIGRSALLLLCVLCTIFVYPSGLSRGKEAPWVRIGTFDPLASASDKRMEDGYYFLLADKQSNVATEECYNRYVRKIVNDEGVQSCTQLSLAYSRSYGQIIMHSVRIIRDGKVIDRDPENE